MTLIRLIRGFLCDRDLYHAAIGAQRQLFRGFNIFADRDADIRQRLFFCSALRPATGQTGAGTL